MAVNGFRKSFSGKRACLAATKNRIFGKWFQFDRNFTPLTRKWFYTFILPSNHFRVTRKRERERESERKREREKERRDSRDRPKSSSLRSSEASIAEIVRRDRRDLTFAPIAIARSVRIWWFFSRFCLCFEEWMILYIHLATEKMWATSRKCVQQVENVFFMIFSITQPNFRKYFSKHFLKCNQTHENIFLSEK